MATETPTRSFAIVGVVGKTDSDDKDLLQDAEDVGRVIGKKHVVLTGGHYRCCESSVKYRALCGAIAANARIINIVPEGTSHKKIEPPVTERIIEVKDIISTDTRGTARSLVVHTQIKSKDRDQITGECVDVLIALKGESGTACEVAAALKVERPVIFFKSWPMLREAVKKELMKSGRAELLPTDPLEADDAAEAVRKALSAIGLSEQNDATSDTPAKSPRLNGRFPANFCPPSYVGDCQQLIDDFDRLKSEYERALLNL